MEHNNYILLMSLLLICYIGFLFWRLSDLIIHLWKRINEVENRIDEIEFSIRADILRLANMIIDHTQPVKRKEEDDNHFGQTRH